MTDSSTILEALQRDGFVVVPKVIPAQDCAEFREQALQWLEKFPHGFKRDDRSTWSDEYMAWGQKGGLYNRYSVTHEDFVWKIRTQPGISDAFAQIWKTDDLIASFDGINVSLPINPDTGRTDIQPTTPWPHMDQDPRNAGTFELCQGIANLAPNGHQDGGLVVLSGSHRLHEQYFASIGGFRESQDLGKGRNGYNYLLPDLDWYRDQGGCREVKICAGEGDLILWDSRTIHWNASPVGEQTRFAAYVCLAPRSMMSEEDLATKLDVFRMRKGTTHFPHQNVIPADRKDYHNALPRRPDDSIDPANRTRPFNEPDETEAVMRLVGVRG